MRKECAVSIIGAGLSRASRQYDVFIRLKRHKE